MRKKVAGYGLALPMILGFALFYVIPVFIMLWYSVSWGIGKREFVGFENFAELFENEMFLLAARNTIRFLVVNVPTILMIALVVALLLQRIGKHASGLRIIYFYPMLLPIASVVLFVQILFGKNGMIGDNWIASEKSFWILCALYIWKYLGYHVLILYARLQMIPKEYYDYASLYGANRWSAFRYITMPILMPVFLFNVVLAIMNAFKCYRESFLLGGNYPDESIYMIQHFVNNNFQNLNYQKISTASVLIMASMIACAVVVYGLYHLQRRKWNV